MLPKHESLLRSPKSEAKASKARKQPSVQFAPTSAQALQIAKHKLPERMHRKQIENVAEKVFALISIAMSSKTLFLSFKNEFDLGDSGDSF